MKRQKNNLSKEETQRLIDERITKYAEQYLENHTAKLKIVNAKTYINFGIRDDITEKSMDRIAELLKLMDIEFVYYWCPRLRENCEFTISIEDDSPKIADFIQKFIDNGYKLKWE